MYDLAINVLRNNPLPLKEKVKQSANLLNFLQKTMFVYFLSITI